MDELVLYDVADRIATVTINRPEKRNALNPDLIVALTNVFTQASEDDEIKVIILKANGTSFSAGADLAYLQQLQKNTFEENVADSNLLRKLYTTIYYLPKIVIAQVEGHAIAGGCGLATICDFIFATPESNFGYSEVKIGFVPAIVSCFLLKKVNETVAKELLFTGNIFNAETALAYKLINFVTNSSDIHQTVSKFALTLCNQSSENSLMVTKQLIGQTNNPLFEKTLDAAVQINARVRESEDFKKGIASFLNKEKINW
ncbi:enoyl-CoA hydratase/isomerase family protein [Pedobacter changchengzhani]|uniref:Enoyl-CoA hydratase/isomerase family protein n=1 Tax=Pedobacter changchengzhani TaxID=2529274 RepID=A0A4R5MJQ4_9SPHI|nr:enoyl-CoA hydratase-related protein [Pedobacter changchengzhani]TDG35778.1 enoyl-CoA hydratase/isomerase family protein [Pedobacter changchengzhani]